MTLSAIQQQLATLSSAFTEEHERKKRYDEETAQQRAHELAGLEKKLAEAVREVHTKKAMLCSRCKDDIPGDNSKGISTVEESRQGM